MDRQTTGTRSLSHLSPGYRHLKRIPSWTSSLLSMWTFLRTLCWALPRLWPTVSMNISWLLPKPLAYLAAEWLIARPLPQLCLSYYSKIVYSQRPHDIVTYYLQLTEEKIKAQRKKKSCRKPLEWEAVNLRSGQLGRQALGFPKCLQTLGEGTIGRLKLPALPAGSDCSHMEDDSHHCHPGLWTEPPVRMRTPKCL